ncbi:MAG: hypothetical protein AB9834_04710 [Lentimicrobium sp.]
MKRYIEQLIEDMHARMQTVNPPSEIWLESEADPTNELELEDMAYVEQYIYGEEKKIVEITGFDFQLFPDPEKLSRKQQSTMAQEMEKFLKHFNFYLDFPESYPNHLRYPFILKFWTEEHVPLSFGENHIEFCSYDEENCPFPGYCEICREVADQMRHDEEQQKIIDEKTRNKSGSGIPDSFFPELPF